MHRFVLWLTPLLLIAVSGCVNQSPPRYFLLQATETALQLQDGLSIGVHPVVVPEYLKRSALLRERRDATLVYSHDGRWGEPLADGIYRVSILELAQRLGTGNIQPWPWSRQQRPAIEVRIHILALEQQDGSAKLSAEIAITDQREETASSQRFIRSWREATAGSADAAVAAAYGRLIQAMNADIARAINS